MTTIRSRRTYPTLPTASKFEPCGFPATGSTSRLPASTRVSLPLLRAWFAIRVRWSATANLTVDLRAASDKLALPHPVDGTFTLSLTPPSVRPAVVPPPDQCEVYQSSVARETSATGYPVPISLPHYSLPLFHLLPIAIEKPIKPGIDAVARVRSLTLSYFTNTIL